MVYNPILDAEIDPESPVTESLMTRLRDNPIAMIEGDSGAPRATSRIITPGGSSQDGAIVDGTSLGTSPGFFEALSLTLTLDKTFPWITLMRVNGNVSCTGTSKTIRLVRPTPGTDDLRDSGILEALGGLSGDAGIELVDSGAGGGGVAGDGGPRSTDSPLAAVKSNAWTGMNRPWMKRRPMVGGAGGKTGSQTGGAGGGCLILLVNGDCDFTGFTIDVSGGQGTGGTGSQCGGGGGGGMIYVICNGTIHNGTFLAKGGNGLDGAAGSGDSSGGGGGLIALVAAAFTGSQTRTVTGGTAMGGGGGSQAGSNGVDLGNITLSEPVINSLMLGAAG